MNWTVEQADCLEWLALQPADSADLVFGSPPYEAQRTYGIDFSLQGQAWVDWMAKVFFQSLRVCKGLVAFVLEGFTKDYRWSATPALLLADLHRAGVNLRKPPIYARVGIPGSGGPDWLRNDWEWIVCATRGGRLPWSDNKMMGHKPLYGPGGKMTSRLKNGKRVHERTFKDLGKGGHLNQGYAPPDIANPGNIVYCTVGGGNIGGGLAHENEAPFPEALAEFFVRSFCPEGGTVLDCFSGSGTTAAVARRWGRSFRGCDVRESQVALTRRRIEGEAKPLFDDRLLGG